MTKFEVTMWEKAEHWTFETTVEAADDVAARKALKREYPAKDYSIRSIRPVWSAPTEREVTKAVRALSKAQKWCD